MIAKKELIMFMPLIGGGGVEKNLYLISNYLSKKINKIKICTISKDKKNKFNNKINFLTPQNDYSKISNIRLKYFIALFELFKYLLKNKNVVVLSFQANIYCILICKLLNINIIVRSNSSPSGWYHNWLKKLIYKKVISLADKIIVNSLEFKHQMENRFKVNVECIFNPLNQKEIIKKSKFKINEKFYNNVYKIINLGRMTEQKDQITILKAINLLKKKINLRLLILGRGIEKVNLQTYINENKLNKYVKLINFIDNPYPYIKKANLFVLSSKYEGLPNVLLEAATLKKTIISTKCPTGPKEILDNGKRGFLFKNDEANALYNSLQKFITVIKTKKN